MARALIIGCGCRGRLLGTELADRGWEVRGTTRNPEAAAAIEAAGIEPAIADPAMPGSLLDHMGDVALVVHLLGQASGPNSRELHGDLLDGLLRRLVDTPVRAFAYEPGGGEAVAQSASQTWHIPLALLSSHSNEEWDRWAVETAERSLAPLA